MMVAAPPMVPGTDCAGVGRLLRNRQFGRRRLSRFKKLPSFNFCVCLWSYRYNARLAVKTTNLSGLIELCPSTTDYSTVCNMHAKVGECHFTALDLPRELGLGLQIILPWVSFLRRSRIWQNIFCSKLIVFGKFFKHREFDLTCICHKISTS